MNFEEFINTFSRLLKDHVDNAEDVSISLFKKTDGTSYTGLLIKNSNNVCPVYNLNEAYRDLNQGKQMEDLVQECISVCNSEKHTYTADWLINSVGSWDFVKPRLRFKLINAEKEQTFEDNVYEKALDLLKVYYVLLNSDGYSSSVVAVNSRLVKRWGVSIEEVKTAAEENVRANYKLEAMHDVLENMGLEITEQISTDLYILSLLNHEFGAAAMMDMQVLAECAEKIGEDKGMYVLPSSVYEVILLNVDDEFVGEAELKRMVRSVNREVLKPEERLSDSVYYFSVTTKSLVIVC